MSELEALRQCADFALLPYAGSGPVGSAELRVEAADFYVTECSGFKPAGSGEHLLLFVRKASQNTAWVAKELARLLQVPYKAVSYAGMKDRHAIAEQWFSVHMPGARVENLEVPVAAGFEILEMAWHNKKLRPGQLSYNDFRIRLRSPEIADAAELERRLGALAQGGVPNYFGPQRFGYDQSNLFLATNLRELRRLDRSARSFALSALRGALFNGYLATRVAAGTWQEELPGDTLVSDRSRGVAEQDRSVFAPQRLPSGPLWGQANGRGSADGSEGELAFVARFPKVSAFLEAAGCRMARRTLKARVGRLRWSFKDDLIELAFSLSPGCFATAVVRELLDARDVARERS